MHSQSKSIRIARAVLLIGITLEAMYWVLAVSLPENSRFLPIYCSGVVSSVILIITLTLRWDKKDAEARIGYQDDFLDSRRAMRKEHLLTFVRRLRAQMHRANNTSWRGCMREPAQATAVTPPDPDKTIH